MYAVPAPNHRGTRLTFQLLIPSLRAVSALSGGLLLMGDGGVTYRPLLADGRLGSPRIVFEAPARTGAVVRGVACILVEGGVQILDMDLRPRLLLTVMGAEAVGTLAGYLTVLHGNGGLTLFDVSGDSEATPRIVGTVDLPVLVQFRGDRLVGALEAPDLVPLPNGVKVPVERDPWLLQHGACPDSTCTSIQDVGVRQSLWYEAATNCGDHLTSHKDVLNENPLSSLKTPFQLINK